MNEVCHSTKNAILLFHSGLNHAEQLNQITYK